MGEVKRIGQSGEDFAHIVPRSKLGLGVEQNGILCCRSHHYMLDFTENRKEMMKIIKGYMLKHYPDWNESELIYKKYDY
jgi:predicted restriction endonuclease